MNLLVIITSPVYELWERTAAWDEDQVLKDTLVRAREVGGDKVFILRQAESKLDDPIERESEIRDVTTPWVTQIANSPEHGADAKVYIAAHSDYVDLKVVRSEVGKERLGACAFFSHQEGSPGLDEISDALYSLIPQPEHDTFSAALDAIKNRQVLTHAQRLSALKHRLAHLFLPISIDLQAWRGFDFDDEYMKEIVNSYGDDEGRLGRARELIYGAGRDAEGDCVEKIVADAGLQGGECWLSVTSLLPRSEPESEAEKRAASVYSEVFQTHDLLGSLKDKKKLEGLKEILRDDNPFNSWYVQLEEALIALRKEMDK